MPRHQLLCILLLAIALPGLPAWATVHDAAVSLAPVGDRPDFQDGLAYEFPVDVLVREGQFLESARLAFSAEFSAGALEPLTTKDGRPAPEGYQRHSYTVRGVYREDSHPRLELVVDGVPHELQLDLSENVDRTVAETRPAYEPGRISLAGLAPPAPAESENPVDLGVAKAARSVRVFGRITIEVRSGVDGAPDEIHGVDGVTVRLMERKGVFLDDVTLGVGVTDANGDFDFTGMVDGTTDVYVELVTKNGTAVNVGNGSFFSTYSRWIETEWNFSGTEINCGTDHFALGDRLNVPLFMASAITRAHRWYEANGIAPGRVSVHYPDDGGNSSFYSRNPGSEGIHMRTDRSRNSGVLLHEYGHHWVGNRASSLGPEYCNDTCDPDDDCGHCAWCAETDAVAWSEGFATFIAWHQGRVHLDSYGWDLPAARDGEDIGLCPMGSFYDDPQTTEGYLSAFARDLVDLDNENDEAIDSTSADRTSFDPMLLYEVAMERGARRSHEFVRDVYEELLVRPGITAFDIADYWSTVRNNGLADDFVPPTAPTFVTSTSHLVGTPSPSSQPAFLFSGGSDDFTGVQGHYVDIYIAPRDPAVGGEYMPLGEEVWQGHVPPGNWYANVRSVDGAGNQSPDWYSYGPFTVSDPVPLDLTPTVALFWEAPLIVRNAPDAVQDAVGWQPNLLASDMYLNLIFKNDSPGSAAVGEYAVSFYLDGDFLHRQDLTAENILPGQIFQLLNVGPFTLPAGRHTVSARVDSRGAISETDETNNATAVIVVADPEPLTPAAFGSALPLAMPYPGDPDGGASALGFNPANRGGVVFTPAARYTLVTARPNVHGVGLRLHAYEPHADPFTGLEAQIGDTAAPAPYGSFVHLVVDRDLFPSSDVEIGVSHSLPDDGGGYTIQATNAFSFPLHPTTPAVLNPVLGEDLDAIAFELNVDFSSVGYLHLKLEAIFSRAEDRKVMNAYWIAPGDPAPFVSNRVPSVQTRGLEPGTVTLDLPVAGKYLLVLMKSPHYSVGPVSVNCLLEMQRFPRPQLVLPEEDPIWDFSMIPLPSYSQNDTLNFPTELLGDVSSTFINFSLMNTGDIEAPTAPVEVYFQGEPLLQLDLGPIPAGGRVEYRDPSPVNIPGGRRTLAVTVDPYGAVEEMEEGNNTFAVQYGWRGPTLFSQTLTRPAPPDPNYYFDEVAELIQSVVLDDGEQGFQEFVTTWAPNCDGLRLEPAFLKKLGGTWVGAAIAPTTLENHDLRLYDGTLGPREAFTRPLATSSWGNGETDFVLVSGAPSQPFDLGVVATSGDDPYEAYATRSEFLGSPPYGVSTYGTYNFGQGKLLGLFEFQLEPGTYTIDLLNQSAVHLGMSVHAPLSEDLTNYHGKDALLEQAPNGWANGPGQAQAAGFVVEEGEQGRWCVAVWRQGYADGAIQAWFNLDVDAQLDDPAPVRVDGHLDPVAYGYGVVLQGVSTMFGDNDEPRLDLANGSELDGAYATIRDGMLYLMLTGNLESNGNDLEIFLDTRPGGMNRLLGGLGDVPDGALARMGDDGSGNGLTFDTQFAADYYLTAHGTPRGLDESGDPYLMDVQMAELTQQWVEGRYLGSTYAAQFGRLYGVGPGEKAAGNLMVNPGFEDPSVGGVESFGAGDGWTTLGGGVYTVTDAVSPPNTGAQSLKLFGSCCSGVFQQFPTLPGEAWAGGVWIYNNPNDPLSGGQVAAVNIEWIQADGLTQSTILPFISNGSVDASTPQGLWTYQTIRGDAPDDAAYARFTLITGDFAPGGPGGAPFYDDASFLRETPAPAEDSSLNPFGLLAAINNANIGGVSAGTGPDSGSGVDTGIEFGIPLSALGDPQGCIRITAFINGREHDFVSNQILGPLPVGTSFLGEPRVVDFSAFSGNQFFEVCPLGVVAVDEVPVRGRTRLHPSVPNPFNPRTTLSFTLDHSGPVELALYDASGRQVKRLYAGEALPAGRHEVSWNGLDSAGRQVASGVYFARLEVGGELSTQRMVLLK